MSEARGLAASLARFVLVGLANTGVGFAVIAGLQLGLGADPRLANAVGYGAGFLLGFSLNRRFVFAEASATPWTLARYGLAIAAAFALNQAVLAVMLPVLGAGHFQALASQGAAVACGTLAFFALCRTWVFRASPVVLKPAGR